MTIGLIVDDYCSLRLAKCSLLNVEWVGPGAVIYHHNSAVGMVGGVTCVVWLNWPLLTG